MLFDMFKDEELDKVHMGRFIAVSCTNVGVVYEQQRIAKCLFDA